MVVKPFYRVSLGAPLRPLWRTAATTLAGASYINSRRTAIFASSYEQTVVSGGGETADPAPKSIPRLHQQVRTILG